MSAMDRQVGGGHYKKMALQPWAVIIKYDLNFFEGNFLKYVARHRSKNGIEDLRKAGHYADMLIEIEKARNFMSRWFHCLLCLRPIVSPEYLQWGFNLTASQALMLAMIINKKPRDRVRQLQLIRSMLRGEIAAYL